MSDVAAARLALGTVQFGKRYGIANKDGQVREADVGAILAEARGAGIDTLDTAVAYGESEACLGRVGIDGWNVVTKLPPIPPGTDDVGRWVERSIAASLERLRVPQLHGLLLHDASQLLGDAGPSLDAALRAAAEAGKVRRFGVSVYGPAELGTILERYAPTLVQLPFSVLDRRLVSSGMLARLGERGIEVHVRSIFLQGLLLMPPERRPPAFARWAPLLARWDAFLAERRLDGVTACVGFALAHPGIARVVFGVDGVAHLRQILAAAAQGPLEVPPELACEDLDLINPTRWRIS